MKTFLNQRTTRPALLGALCLSLPLASSCAQAQDGQNPAPKRGKGQRGKRPNAQNRPNAGAAATNARPGEEGVADLEVNPNAGQAFPIQAPMSAPIPASNVAPPTGAIFVSPDANAGGAGTSQTPTTLQNALKIAPLGGTIVLRGGVYRTGDLVLPRRLTLQAFPGESPQLKGSVVVAGWVKDGNLWRHDGWKAEFPPVGRFERGLHPDYPMAVYGDQAFLDGKALFQMASRAQVKAGQFFVDYKNDALYIGDDPTGKEVEATVHSSGLDVVRRGAAAIDATGSVVRGLGFTHYARQGMILAAPKVLIENCAFVWNGNRGLYLNAGSGAAAVDCIVRGNTLVANGQTGLSAGAASRLLFEKNYAAHNNIENFRRAWGASGVKFFGMDGLIVRDNVVESNNATGIWLDVNVNGATVVHNVARLNAGSGIYYEISDRAIIAFNVCRGNSVGVHLLNAHNARVYNNTLVDNESNVRVNQSARKNIGDKGGTPDNTVVANTPTGSAFTSRGHIFKNNILWNARSNAANPLFEFVINPNQPQSARRAGDMVVALSHNAYHRAAAAPKFVQGWSPTGAKIENYATLQEFTAASGKGQNSLLTSGADPYFVDAAKNDFRLKTGSPAIGKAEPLPADIAQAAGVNANIGYLGALPPA